jgi:hypothetical protein
MREIQMPDWQKYIKFALTPRIKKESLIEKIHREYGIPREDIETFIGISETPEDVNVQVELEQNGEQGISTRLVSGKFILNKSPEDLLRVHGYDPDLWTVLRSKAKSWNAYSKVDKISNLYSSTVHVIPKVSITAVDALKVLEAYQPKPLEPIVYPKVQSPHMLELGIYDVHLGKLTWEQEVGKDYDTDIAMKRYQLAVERALQKSQHLNKDKIVLTIGQDFFNCDNNRNSTNKGTPQSADSRWQRMFNKGLELSIWTIEKLRREAPTDVLYVPGNHDLTFSYFLSVALSAYFRNTPGVTIDTSPKVRKYYQYGKCLIGFTHGEEKPKNLDKVMQDEAHEMWGSTIHRELHIGHKHIEEVVSLQGMKIRRVPSFVENDDWHYQEGYVGQEKVAQAFVWHPEDGLSKILFI